MHKEDGVKSQVLNHSVSKNKESNIVTVQYLKGKSNHLLSSTQLNWEYLTLTEP